MPRKKIVKEPEKVSNSVDELLTNRKEEDHVIMQLELTDTSINNITNVISQKHINEPSGYQPVDFSHDAEIISDNNFIDTRRSVCFWCCHELVDFSCGMPIKYTVSTNHFDVFGTFCSFQCASAYNFSINSKSYKVWDINSLINMLASRYGILENIKPAPSRYVLKMFGGEMTIEEFRIIHKENDRSLVLNIPPMTTINASTELLNTSYMNMENIKQKNSIDNKMMCI
tara:strand:- start:12320 stop:13003 length:684 start_codon:yes stop_codon:yes gene_type:complete